MKQPMAGTLLPETKAPSKGDISTLPVRVVRVPLVRVSSGASIPGAGPKPIFPTRELEGRQDGFVHVEFVIGADGRLVPGTFRLANAMTPGYARAVMNAIEHYGFTPAMAGDCGIPARMSYTFTFDVY